MGSGQLAAEIHGNEQLRAAGLAIRRGQMELDALYGNELTGLCRPEELLRLCERSQQWGRRLGVKVDTAMISDVPGYTWGIVPALAQAGAKYFSIGRIRATAWADEHRVGPINRSIGSRPTGSTRSSAGFPTAAMRWAMLAITSS